MSIGCTRQCKVLGEKNTFRHLLATLFGPIGYFNRSIFLIAQSIKSSREQNACRINGLENEYL